MKKKPVRRRKYRTRSNYRVTGQERRRARKDTIWMQTVWTRIQLRKAIVAHEQYQLARWRSRTDNWRLTTAWPPEVLVWMR